MSSSSIIKDNKPKMDFEKEESFDLSAEIADLGVEDNKPKQPAADLSISGDDLSSERPNGLNIQQPLGIQSLKRKFTRQATLDIDQPPTYFPVVIRKVAKRSKKAQKVVASLDCLEEGRSLDYETALGEFKKNAGTVELMMCVTMYNEPFEQVKDSLTGVIRSIAELLNVDRKRFQSSIGIAIIADGYDRVDEEFLKLAEMQRFIDRREMMDYFLQPEQDDEEAGPVEPKVTNKLKPLTKFRKDIKNPELYETPNFCHIFHNRLNLSGFLASHLIEGTDA